MRFPNLVRSHRRTVGVVFGFACGLSVGGVTQLAHVSGLSLYAIWALTIFLVLAVVAPWALRGTGRRIPIQEAHPPNFQLVRLWYGRSAALSIQGETGGLDDDDAPEFLVDARRYEHYAHVK